MKPSTPDTSDSFDPAVEDALRRALAPVDPPAGFADRVIRRASARSERTVVGGSLIRWAAAAALVLVAGGISGGFWYHAGKEDDRRRAEGEEAKRQVLLSLEITSTKLRAVQMKINRLPSQDSQGESRQ